VSCADGVFGSRSAVFGAEEIDILKTAPQAPRMNAHRERIIQTLRHELCDLVLILNEAHAWALGNGPRPR
jgi:hypothetical protein